MHCKNYNTRRGTQIRTQSTSDTTSGRKKDMRVIRSCDMDNGSDNETESVLQLASVGDKDCKHCGVSLHNRMKCNWTPGSEFTLMNKNVICSALILWGKMPHY